MFRRFWHTVSTRYTVVGIILVLYGYAAVSLGTLDTEGGKTERRKEYWLKNILPQDLLR